jgi:2-C-methyl-D-erythritol 4-phosphate cytidylyltransferase
MHGAVILAAGSSARMGSGLKKEFLLYKNKPLLYYSVKAFIDCGLFSTLLVTCRADLMDQTRSFLADFMDSDLFTLEFTSGGDSRQNSVLKSLEFLKDKGLESVLIHDGARPFVSCGTISRVLDGVIVHGACIPVEPSTNTMKLIDSAGRITVHLAREFTRGAQTPQGFKFSPLLDAHRKVCSQGLVFTDDSEIWDRFEGNVFTVEGNRENQKVTYPEDLAGLDLLYDKFPAGEIL